MINIYTLIIFIAVVIIHELGHYIFYMIFGKIPTIKFTWLGAIVIGGKAFYDLTNRQAMWVGSAGIVFGLIPALFLGKDFILIYLCIMCLFDFGILISTIICRYKWKTPNVWDYTRKYTVIRLIKEGIKKDKIRIKKLNTTGEC